MMDGDSWESLTIRIISIMWFSSSFVFGCSSAPMFLSIIIHEVHGFQVICTLIQAKR